MQSLSRNLNWKAHNFGEFSLLANKGQRLCHDLFFIPGVQDVVCEATDFSTVEFYII